VALDNYSSGALRLLPDDDGSRKLAFIMCLPLIDGVFATLLVTGAVNTFSQMINVAITVFAGAGAIAVLYSESNNRGEAVQMIHSVLPIVMSGALMVALLAPIFESVFQTDLLKYAGGLALVSIALQLSGIEIAEKFPPEAIVVTGMVLSFQGLGGLGLTLSYIVPALTTVIIAVTGLYAATLLKKYQMNLEYIRYGGSMVLALISLSLFGVKVPDPVGPVVFGTSILLSIKRR